MRHLFYACWLQLMDSGSLHAALSVQRVRVSSCVSTSFIYAYLFVSEN